MGTCRATVRALAFTRLVEDMDLSVDVTLREFVRHSLHRLGVLEPLRRLRSGTVRRGLGQSLEERFSHIYKEGVWQTSPDAPLSGAGSHPSVAGRLGSQLPDLVRELGIREFLDVGCGDFSWMRDVELGCNYTGIDIVPDVIARNAAEHGRPDRQFRALNAVSEMLPAADMVLCREVLFHLSFQDARALLANVRRSGARWLLATTDSVTRFNADIDSGDFRVLNLTRAPFNFPAPLRWLADDALVPDRRVGVWDVQALAG